MNCTDKDQWLINSINGEAICINEAKGTVHDFELFRLGSVHIHDKILLPADKGSQGICAIHALSLTPFKKPRKGKLSAQQRAFNRNVVKIQIRIECVNRRVTRFKMFQDRYRNKPRKHLPKLSPVCGIYNFESGF